MSDGRAPAGPDSAARPASPLPKGAAMLVGASLFMEMLDGTILATALPSVAHDFGLSPVRLQIAITAYLMAMAICIPASGWLARLVGAKRLFTAAIGLFTLASLACALAQGVTMLVAARLVQGIASAMMMPVGRLLILRNLPKDQLVHAIAILTWPALLAPAIAPPLGGLIVQYTSWHWLFLINLPLGLVGMALAPRLLPATPTEPPGSFDLLGLLLWAATAAAIIIGLGDLARRGGSAAIAALLVSTVASGLFFRHLRRARHPLLELDLLADRNLGHSLRGGGLVRMAIFAQPFLQPLLLQVGLGMTPVDSGMLLLIGMIGNIGMKPLTTRILQRYSYSRTLVVNGILLTCAFALFALISRNSPWLVIAALLICTGMLRSMHFTALNTLSFQSIPGHRMTAANTLFSTTMQMNAALGVSVGALALQIWPMLGSSQDNPLAPFRFAFLIVAAMTLVGSLAALRLRCDTSSLETQCLEPLPSS